LAAPWIRDSSEALIVAILSYFQQRRQTRQSLQQNEATTPYTKINLYMYMHYDLISKNGIHGPARLTNRYSTIPQGQVDAAFGTD
jgi:hypothetical protein